MATEGGFQGRTNKLVDGCYSFWQAGGAVLMELITSSGLDLINKEKLFTYVYACCQSSFGGLRDKPSKSPDFYHTCYCLSGLSISQYRYSDDGVLITSDVLHPSAKTLVLF
jgi:protein farnesyltransferase subunit beta